MVQSPLWRSIGQSDHLKIDWSSLSDMGPIDPYLPWFDITEFQGAPVPPVGSDVKLVPLILELNEAYAGSAVARLSELEVVVPRRYLGRETRFVTGRLRADALGNLLAKGVGPKGSNKPILRYEVGLPIGNPDGRAVDLFLSFEGGKRAKPKPRQPTQSDLVAFIDHGCAFAHRKFRRRDKPESTRIVALWDQAGGALSAAPVPPTRQQRMHWNQPEDFEYGAESLAAGDPDIHGVLRFDPFIAQFRSAGHLDEAACYRVARYEPAQRNVAHGTHVMDVATGYPSPLPQAMVDKGWSRDPATGQERDIVFVQLPRYVGQQQVSGLLRANVLDALTYIESCLPSGKKVVVNLSYGSYAGPHDGDSILELAMDELIEAYSGRITVVVPAGNALDQAIHAQVRIPTGGTRALRWNNRPDDPSDSFVEIWVPEFNALRVRVTPPQGVPNAGDWVGPGEAKQLSQGRSSIAAVVNARSVCQGRRGTMVLLAVAPTTGSRARAMAPYGEWTIELGNIGRSALDVDAWCERDDPVFGTEGGPRQSYFGGDTEATGTLNSIAHGRQTRVVGGYVLGGDVAPYSGTGPGRNQRGRDRHPAHGPTGPDFPKRGPELYAPCEESVALPGFAAAAVYGDDTVRLPGTSIACAVFTRYLVEIGTGPGEPSPSKSDTPVQDPPPTTRKTETSRHPDAGAAFGRVGHWSDDLKTLG